MIKNTIIGVLIGCMVATSDFWQYSNGAQQILTAIIIGGITTGAIWYIEDAIISVRSTHEPTEFIQFSGWESNLKYKTSEGRKPSSNKVRNQH